MFRQVVSAAVLVVAWGTIVSAGTLDRVKETGVFKMGFREDAAPFAYRDALGEPAGYAVDLCRAVAAEVKQELGLAEMKVEYVPVGAKDRFDAVSTAAVDIHCGPTSITLSRRKIVDFSIPTYVDGASAMFLAGGPATFEDLAGKKVGVRSGTTTEEALRSTMTKLAINAEVVSVADHADGLAKLDSGDVAAYFADRGILFFLAKSSEAPERLRISDRHFTHEPYGLPVARGDADFRLVVDRALSRVYSSPKIAEIYRASFGANTRPSPAVAAVYMLNQLRE